MDRADILVSAEELSAELQDDRVIVLDARFSLLSPVAGREGYRDGHIPGAVYVDVDKDLAAPVTAVSGRHPLPDADVAARMFRRCGVSDASRVIVYDDSAGSMAARAWWMLRWLGHEHVRILDGGIHAWRGASLELEAGDVAVDAGNLQANPNARLLIGTEELQAVDLSTVFLLDARDAERFSGAVEPIDVVAGHIPGARSFPFAETIADSGCFLPVERLQELWVKNLAGDLGRPSVVMCGSGVTACHLIASALLAGAREPRLYVGSWSAWIGDPGRPVACVAGTP